MKLVQKLTLALFLGISLILAANGYFRVRREVAAFRDDRVRDHALIGRSLGAAFSAVWRLDGESSALAMLDESRARDTRVRPRWVRLDDSLKKAFDPARPGESVTRVAEDETGDARRYTYVPVVIGSEQKGAIEVSESLSTERRFLRATIQDTTAATVSLAVVCGVLSVMLGVWLVGRPVGMLMDKARRIGLGDFSGALDLPRKDELGELGAEMNAMCDRLVEANERAARETSARIAAIEQLRHADRLTTVGKLASGIAHELGTPLNVVSARASMIASGEAVGSEIAEYAQIVVEASDRMARIIRDLLEFARRRSSEKAPVDVAVLTEGTLTLLRSLASKKQITIGLDSEVDVVVNADAGQLQQSLTNLVVNSIQASERGGHVNVQIGRASVVPPADVELPPGSYVFLRVKDRGCGIGSEHLAHVFEPFFTTKEVGEGTGLGLSVTYGIVRDHGGWIAVESAVGEGATFTIYLPSR